MTEFYNVEEINCKKLGDKWECEVTRRLSEKLTRRDNMLCYPLKTETIRNLDHVELQEGLLTKCAIMKTDKTQFMKCEAR